VRLRDSLGTTRRLLNEINSLREWFPRRIRPSNGHGNLVASSLFQQPATTALPIRYVPRNPPSVFVLHSLPFALCPLPSIMNAVRAQSPTRLAVSTDRGRINPISDNCVPRSPVSGLDTYFFVSGPSSRGAEQDNFHSRLQPSCLATPEVLLGRTRGPTGRELFFHNSA
jgi:hypothetical protein